MNCELRNFERDNREGKKERKRLKNNNKSYVISVHMAQPVNALPGSSTSAFHPYQGNIPQSPTPISHGYSGNYNRYSGRATGWIQLCCGVGAIFIGVAQFLLGSSSLRFFSFGIWMGLCFFGPTGIIGIASFRGRTCVITAYLVMSIICIILAMAMMISGTVVASFGLQWCYIQDTVVPCQKGLAESRTASDGILGLIGFIEMMVAIIASVYCCASICCGKQSGSQEFMLADQHPNVTLQHQGGLPYYPGNVLQNPYTQLQLGQMHPQQQTPTHQQAFQTQQSLAPQQAFLQQQTRAPHQVFPHQHAYQQQQTLQPQMTFTPQLLNPPQTSIQQAYPSIRTHQPQQMYRQQYTQAAQQTQQTFTPHQD
ncbi:uncharacterized protein LOC121423503 isoform X2 [Lytechinus variegatus]|uniref:uncharacterized protein LOC121423503 isoform X2 n=1 Tax=Lytechinus variegatus TaxID=7654 RepID=UPI001BB262D5|nr:uncharacterized protein LOC121423503 isoform X2 [Lytechinus variegatus]